MIYKKKWPPEFGRYGRSFLFVVIAIIVRDPRLTIRVLTSIIKIRKGVVHIMVSSKLTMKARSAKTSARVMWHPPFYLMCIGRKTSKSALPCSFRSKERCSKAGRSIAACVWRNSAFPANKDTTKTDRKQSFSLLTGGKDILYNTVIEILARTSG